AGDRGTVEARIWDLKAHQLILGRRYSGGVSYVERIAHTLANDLVKEITGKSGIFLSTILFVSDRDGAKDIYAMDFDGRSVHRLTSHHSLALNPDGRGGKVVFTSYQSRFPQIWLMNADGAGARRVTHAGNWNDEGAWSPDGSKIAFACRNEGDFNICVMDFASGNTVQLTSEGSNGHPAWSPTGEKIVYQSRRGASTQI